ncbi:GntR family transcriptional regulator [Cloacibacillus sp.]
MAVENSKVSWIKAYDWIKDEIDSCRFKMGEPLTETYLAKAVGVSRTPIREALRILAQTGYVKIIPLKGAFVSDVSIEDMREIFDMRRLLEPFAAVSAASRIPNTKLKELTIERELLTKKQAGGVLDAASVIDLDLKLHMTIAAHAANKRIGDTLIAGYNQIKRFQRFSTHSQSNIQKLIEQHAIILDCLKARDPTVLHQCIYEHVISGEEFIMRDYFLR